MKRKHCFSAVLLIISFSLLTFCGKKEQQQTGEISQHEETPGQSIVQTIKPKAINYDSMLTVIGDLTKAVKENPVNITVRQKLVAACYDTTWETILAAGFGEPSQKANTESISNKFKEQAAEADALRWAAYIKKWHTDPTKPELGSISAEIQGSRIVAKKSLADSTVVVLVELKSSNIF